MTKQELSKLYRLNRKIEMLQRELQALESCAYGPPGPNISGMPPGSNVKQSNVERYAAEVADLKAIIAAKQIECVHERNRLIRWVAEVDGWPEQDIFYYRYVSGLSWSQVAANIGGGNNADSVRIRHDRYLQKINSQQTENS